MCFSLQGVFESLEVEITQEGGEAETAQVSRFPSLDTCFPHLLLIALLKGRQYSKGGKVYVHQSSLDIFC